MAETEKVENSWTRKLYTSTRKKIIEETKLKDKHKIKYWKTKNSNKYAEMIVN